MDRYCCSGQNTFPKGRMRNSHLRCSVGADGAACTTAGQGRAFSRDPPAGRAWQQPSHRWGEAGGASGLGRTCHQHSTGTPNAAGASHPACLGLPGRQPQEACRLSLCRSQTLTLRAPGGAVGCSTLGSVWVSSKADPAMGPGAVA